MASSRSVIELEVLFEWIAGIGRHERISETLHRIQALFRHQTNGKSTGYRTAFSYTACVFIFL